MATIAVLGATGGTGLEVVRQALAGGLSVRALVRTPEKLGVKHDKLTVVKGNASNAADVEAVRWRAWDEEQGDGPDRARAGSGTRVERGLRVERARVEIERVESEG